MPKTKKRKTAIKRKKLKILTFRESQGKKPVKQKKILVEKPKNKNIKSKIK
jgi:hypothetical protein